MNVEMARGVLDIVAQQPEAPKEEHESSCSCGGVTTKVFLVGREVLSAIGKGCLGLGIIFAFDDKCVAEDEKARKVASFALCIIGVVSMMASSICGTVSHLRCNK